MYPPFADEFSWINVRNHWMHMITFNAMNLVVRFCRHAIFQLKCPLIKICVQESMGELGEHFKWYATMSQMPLDEDMVYDGIQEMLPPHSNRHILFMVFLLRIYMKCFNMPNKYKRISNPIKWKRMWNDSYVSFSPRSVVHLASCAHYALIFMLMHWISNHFRMIWWCNSTVIVAATAAVAATTLTQIYTIECRLKPL